MQARQGLLELFSTFLNFESDRIKGWIADARLQRSMQTCLQQATQSDLLEAFWVLYWHQIWQRQSSPVAAGHLSAYLQEVCYWAARKLSMNLASGQSITDFFQIAIANHHKVLKGFDPQRGIGLKRYASMAFSNIIKDTLRLRQEVDICTNWALLYKLSQKRLVESLQNLGLQQPTIEPYLLAWRCLKAVHGPADGRVARKLEKPDAATWAKIAQLYNSQRLTDLGAAAETCSPETLEKWLNACANAARSYLYPTVLSADAPKPGQDQGDFLEDLQSTFQDSVLTEVIAQEEAAERQAQRTQVNAILLRSLIKLDVQSQRLLQMYYGQGLTQQEIAQQLAVKQYTISRRISSLKRSLLSALGEWSQTTLHQPLNSDVVNHMSTLLEEWLKMHYSHPDLSSQ